MMSRMIRWVMLGVFTVILPFSAMAQTGANYMVRDIPVSATASDATTARLQALAEGEIIAYEKMLAQVISPSEAAVRFKNTDKSQISRLVRSYEVREEKLTATSYEAVLDIAFDEKQVSAMLSNKQGMPTVSGAESATGVPIQDVSSMIARGNAKSTVLVLPVKRQGDGVMLWENDNGWRQAWNQVDRGGADFIRLPIGDQSDQTMLQNEGITHSPYESFSLIAERYQAATVLVAEAVYSDGASVLDVNLRSLALGGQMNELTLTYEADPNETTEVLLVRAAQDIAERLLSEGQQREVQSGLKNKVTVLMRIGEVGDWVVLRRRLTSLPNVDRVELAAISEQQADIILHYRGSPDALAAGMASQGLQVSKAYNYWVVAF